MRKTAWACLLVLTAAGCGPEVKSEFAPRESYAAPAEAPAERIQIETGDLLRPYAILGEITVSAVTSPGHSPDRALKKALIAKAREIGADAVIELKTEVVLAGALAYTANQFRDIWGQTYAGQKAASDHDRTVWRGTAVRFPK